MSGQHVAGLSKNLQRSPPTKNENLGAGLRPISRTYLPCRGSPPRSDLRQGKLLGPATVCRVFVSNMYNTKKLCPKMLVQEIAGFVGGQRGEALREEAPSRAVSRTPVCSKRMKQAFAARGDVTVGYARL